VGHEVVPLVSGGHEDVTPVLGAKDAPGVEHKGPPPVLDVRRGDALAVGLQEDNPGLGVRHGVAAPGLYGFEGVKHGVTTPVVNVVDQKDLTGEISSNNDPEIVLCPYEVFVTSPVTKRNRNWSNRHESTSVISQKKRV
jgi:hypothetical protein